MQRSSPLRWFAAIGIMLLVVLISVPLLMRTISQTVRLSSGESEDPAAGLSEAPEGSEQASEAEGDSDEAEGDFPQTYTVAEGDTGDSISEQFYGNPDGWERIAEANDIDPSGGLRVGTELEIPAPE